jgi:hypothetical protein
VELVIQGGVGSVVSVVALELSTASVNGTALTTVAFAKLSLAGSPGDVTVSGSEDEGPPPGRGFTTVIPCTPPNARSVCEMTADREVAELNVVVTPDTEPSN